jgi:hypothetical protein
MGNKKLILGVISLCGVIACLTLICSFWPYPVQGAPFDGQVSTVNYNASSDITLVNNRWEFPGNISIPTGSAFHLQFKFTDENNYVISYSYGPSSEKLGQVV